MGKIKNYQFTRDEYKKISSVMWHTMINAEINIVKDKILGETDTDGQNMFNTLCQVLENVPGNSYPERTREDMLRLCACLQIYLDAHKDEIADYQYAGGKVYTEKPDCSPAGE